MNISARHSIQPIFSSLKPLKHKNDGPHFGDGVIRVDGEHADYEERRDLIQQAIGDLGHLVPAKEFHGHGAFDLLVLETQQNKQAEQALKPLKQSGLVPQTYWDKPKNC